MRHRFARILAVAAAVAVLHVSARPEGFPARRVTSIVPYAVGGATDAQLRVLGWTT